MPKMKVNSPEMAEIDNIEVYNFYINRMIELSIALFKWENLPETCDERYIETALFQDGQCVFFKDPDIGGIISLSSSPRSSFDVYGYPNEVEAYSKYNNYRMKLNRSNSVICFNNMIKTNSMSGAMYYAQRLWLLDRIIDLNIKAQKTPVLLQASEKERLTIQNLYAQYEGNAPVIFGTKNLDPNEIKVLKTDAPFLADKLYEMKSNIWNEALTYLGITNVNITKKERLITDEVERSQGGTIAGRFSRLEARRQAANKINKMFGTSIRVEFREDVDPEVLASEMPTTEEVEEVAENE